MYVFFTERQSECPKLAADILRKIENHFARSARRIRIVKNREKEMATVSPLRNAGASLSAQRFGRNRRQLPDFSPCRMLLAPPFGTKGVEHATSEFPKREFPRFPIVHIFFVLLARPESTKIKIRRKRAGDGSVVRSAIFAVQNCRSARTRSMKGTFKQAIVQCMGNGETIYGTRCRR